MATRPLKTILRFRVGTNFEPGAVHLVHNNWDDWFEFATLFQVIYLDPQGERHDIGMVKIGEFGLQGMKESLYKGQPGYRSPNLRQRFTDIGADRFSLGQDTSYYENLTRVSAAFRRRYLRAMNDIALDQNLLARVQTERVTGLSLLRDVPLPTVKNQYGRLAVGKPKLTDYAFGFALKDDTADPFGDAPPCRLTFAVNPNSRPPTNIHVLIGRNGVGKSTTLHDIATSVVEESQQEPDPFASAPPQWQQLSNLVSVSFSAFDMFEPIRETRDRAKGLTYRYIGLRKKGAKPAQDSPLAETKDHAAISREMTASAKTCLIGARRRRWHKALTLLEADPLFAGLGLTDLIDAAGNRLDEDILSVLPQVFRRLSSGHKIVLLTITQLVETVEEKTLVLLDEPEAHLHPPLLSAFVRALSDLLTDRNGLAIVATHSPVVLQEVPKSCVWRLQRIGRYRSADRLTIETFGENVGTLTNEVFGLEVRATGFHTMLDGIASEATDYESALASFSGELGAEGRGLLRAMVNGYRRDRSVGR